MKAIFSFQNNISLKTLYSGLSIIAAGILFCGQFCGTIFAQGVSTIPSLSWSPYYSTNNYYPIAGSPGQAQGIATDGTNLYTTHNLNIVKTLKTPGNYTLVASNYSPFPVGVGSFNHMLDIEYYDGKLYGGAMKYNNGAVATSSNSCILVYNATTLALESYAFVTNEMYCLTAMTIAPEEGVIYATYVNPLTATNLFVYDMDTFALVRSVPLSRPIYQCQDLEYKNGSIYAVCDNFNGAGMVFQITTNGVVADGPQMFLTPQGHEAEGLDISGSELLYYPAGSTNVYSFPQISEVETNSNEQALPVNKGLRLHYSFSETNGSPYTVDRSLHGNHGFFSAITDDMITTGLRGGGYNGKTRRFITVKGTDVSGWTNLTVNAWVKYTNAFTTFQFIASKYLTDAENEWYFRFASHTNLVGAIHYTNNAQSFFIGKVPTVSDGEWHMVTMTLSDDALSLYFDGAFITAAANSGTKKTLHQFPIQVGGFNLFNQFNFTGAMDELKIWDRALSAQEIGEQFKNPFSFPFTSIRVSNQDIALTWQSDAGEIYALDSSTNLVDWTPLATNLISSNTTLSFATNISGTHKFFRASRVP